MLRIVDDIEVAISSDLNNLQQSSTSERHLFETKGMQNEWHPLLTGIGLGHNVRSLVAHLYVHSGDVRHAA